LLLDSIYETPQFVLSKQGKTQLVDSGGNLYYKHKGSQIMERPPGNVLVILRQNVRLVSQLMIQAFAF